MFGLILLHIILILRLSETLTSKLMQELLVLRNMTTLYQKIKALLILLPTCLGF